MPALPLHRTLSSIVLVLLVSCSGGGEPAGPLDAMGVDVPVRNGCPVLSEPVASPGDDIGGDTWDTFARGFFADYCVRCHSTTLVGEVDRSCAPAGRDWDDEASVRMALDLIRMWVGEANAMPIGEPKPSCDGRLRLVRWIDAGAP